MRGIRSAIDEIIVFVRIIPAHAGNTQASIRSVLPVSFCFLKDHPRSCGEYLFLARLLVVNLGSSPLMRGILSDFF